MKYFMYICNFINSQLIYKTCKKLYHEKTPYTFINKCNVVLEVPWNVSITEPKCNAFQLAGQEFKKYPFMFVYFPEVFMIGH